MTFTVHGAPGLESFIADMVLSFCGFEPSVQKPALKHDIAEDNEVIHAGEGPFHFRFNDVLYSDLKSAVIAIARAAKAKSKTVFGDSAENSKRLAYFLDALEAGVEYDRAIAQSTKAAGEEAKECGASGPDHCRACPQQPGSVKAEACCTGGYAEGTTPPGPCTGNKAKCSQNCECCGPTCRVYQLKSWKGAAPAGYPLPAGAAVTARPASPYTEFEPSRKNKYLCENTYLYGEQPSVGDVVLIARLFWHLYTCPKAGDAKTADAKTTQQLCSIVGMPDTIEQLLTTYPALYRLANTLSKDPRCADFINMKGEKPKGFLKNAPPTQAGQGDAAFPWEDFKRLISNTKDIKGEVMPYLKKHYDPSTMTIYKMTYEKMEDELTKAFVACNHMNGFIQRFRPQFAKGAFARMYVVGEEPTLDLIGLWIVEGNSQRLPEGITSHPSWEFYMWETVDIAKEDVIYDFLKQGEVVDKRPVVQRFDFK